MYQYLNNLKERKKTGARKTENTVEASRSIYKHRSRLYSIYIGCL